MEKKIGVCPVCNGTGRRPCPDNLREDGRKRGWYGYSAEDDSVPCNNCGGQTMYGKPTGQVPLRRDNGEPCVHEYTVQEAGRCYRWYTCSYCGYRFDIDSGD